MQRYITKRLFAITVLSISGLYLLFAVADNRRHLASIGKSLIDYRKQTLHTIPQPTPTPDIPVKPTLAPVVTLALKKNKPLPPADTSPWGVAKKVDDVTYTIKVGEDARMATPQEILTALNNYRNVHGAQSLTWSDTLGGYAQSRAQEFQRLKTTDKHAGFNNYLSNENGFEKLGYMRVGENSYYGGKLDGVHMIEWVFAQSPGHNANQLDTGWSHVGIGVTDVSANLIFGSN